MNEAKVYFQNGNVVVVGPSVYESARWFPLSYLERTGKLSKGTEQKLMDVMGITWKDTRLMSTPTFRWGFSLPRELNDERWAGFL